jgi:hypothetical protein
MADADARLRLVDRDAARAPSVPGAEVTAFRLPRDGDPTTAPVTHRGRTIPVDRSPS